MVTIQDIPAKISDAEKLARIQRVFTDPEEAQAIFEYDKMVEQTKEPVLEFDFPKDSEQHKIAQSYCHTGTRTPKQKKPVGYKWDKKERKPNATKGALIEEMAQFFVENTNFAVENFQIPNKEGKIAFKIGGKWYTFSLTEHRSKPKDYEGD